MSSVKAKILKATKENLSLAAKALREGQVVAIPTETVYGLAGIAFDEAVLTKIFKTKERPTFDPLIVHVDLSEKKLAALVALGLVDATKYSNAAKRRVDLLLETFWPGPLTVVLTKNPNVPDLATSGLSTVAVRMPKHPIARALICEVGMPLAAPSANRFGRISPTQTKHVLEELGDRIEYILEGGECEVGLESTVIAIDSSGNVTLLRPGGTPVEQLEKVIGAGIMKANASTDGAQRAPGMLASHYAPKKPLVLLSKRVEEMTQAELQDLRTKHGLGESAFIGLLRINGSVKLAAEKMGANMSCKVVAHTLSETGNLEEAARKLFSTLRELDGSRAQVLFAEPPASKEGLGYAIADRLSRAAAPK